MQNRTIQNDRLSTNETYSVSVLYNSDDEISHVSAAEL